MGILFDQPVWLWSFAVFVPLAVVGLRWFLAMSRWRRASALLTRALLTGLIAAMLAGAQSVRETDRLAVIGVVDVSGSVRRFADLGPGIAPEAFARSFFDRRLEGRGPDDLFGLVVFDGRAVTVSTPTRSTVLDRSMTIPPVEGTDIAGALNRASALIPPDAAGRIVLISDGNATTGDPVSEAASLGSGTAADPSLRIPVDVVPLSYRVDGEVIVERLDAPPRAPGHSVVPLRVQIRSTGRSTGTLRLEREGEPVDLGGPGGGLRLTLEPGRRIERLEVPLEGGRLSRFRVIYEPDVSADGTLSGDRSIENNRAEAFTISPGENRVLVVDGVSDGAADGAGMTLPRSLRRAGLDVEVVAPAGMPRDMLGLQAFDTVILQNVAAEEMPERTQEILAAFVRELGGGLIVVGGPDTLGAGGWRGSTLEAILPVELDLPERLVVPEAAIVFVLDASGSMAAPVLGSSRSQQSVANEAAARAIESIDHNDMVGVIAFSTAPWVVAPLTEASDRDTIASATRGISSGGGTNIAPALEIARAQLMDVDVKTRHIILLSDGQSMRANELPALAESIRADGIRITSIAVGDGADLETLRAIADRGDGAFYHVLNPTVLPAVFLKAVRVMRSPLVREQPFEVVMRDTGSPLTAGLGRPPPLEGLVLTQERGDPSVTTAMSAPSGEPVLAHWPVELGRVAVFTSDASRWARHWLDWPGYEMFWSRAARLLARSTGQEMGEFRVEPGDGRIVLTYDAADAEGRPIDLLHVPVTVFGPGDGEPTRAVLRQTGPGRYVGSVRALRSGNYIVIARPNAAGVPLPPLLSGATVAGGAEYGRPASDIRTMRRIAEVSGGRVLDASGDPGAAPLFDRGSIEPRRTRSPLWPVLLGWTLVVFLLDVGTRRIAWDRLLPDLRIDAARAAAGSGQSVSALRRVRRRPKRRVKTLGEEDAERLKQEARRRRYEAKRAARLARGRAEGGASKPDEPGPKPIDDDGAEQGGPAGLMAAKRRARQRFEREEPDEG